MEILLNGKKLANALKLRIGLRMANAEPEKARAAIESASGDVFTNLDDEAKFPYLSEVPDQFPLNEEAGAGIPSQFFVSATLVNHLKQTNDPRLGKYAELRQFLNDIVGKPYGIGDFSGN